MSVRRKCAELLQYFNPFAANLESPPPQDEALPAAKRPRLDASTSSSTAADADDLDTICVAPTDSVTVPASLPIFESPRARAPPRKWTQGEDATLIEAVKELGMDWVAVAALVPSRTNHQCRQRWLKGLYHDSPHRIDKWTPAEDAELTDTVKELGLNNWAAVAARVPGRINEQCRRRWVDCLDSPNLRHATADTRWTSEELALLTDAVKELGTKNWGAVAARVPGRTKTQCRPRWHRTLISKVHKWTAEEDAKLIEAVTEHGNRWTLVAAMVPGRINKQCRHRWTKHLDPTIEHNVRR
jgi:myb proto-oncogene protein